jgi:hypothetical protein
MGQSQFRLRTVMIAIAILALVITVMMQGVFLQRGAVREQMLQAEAERARAVAEQARLLAEQELAEAQVQLLDVHTRPEQAVDRPDK